MNCPKCKANIEITLYNDGTTLIRQDCICKTNLKKTNLESFIEKKKTCDKENFCEKGIMLSSCEARIWVKKCPEFDSIDSYIKYILNRRKELDKKDGTKRRNKNE